MHVGLDFDNTIVSYDRVFHRVAVEQGLVPPHIPATKNDVRDFLRDEGREHTWIELQGYVYGARYREAVPFPGVTEFFRRCRVQAVPVSIVSHRTRYPFAGRRYDLHQAAHEWLREFLGAESVKGTSVSVFLELTKSSKLERIASEECTVFVDDLPEFLAEPGFPPDVERILFDPYDVHELPEPCIQRARSWQEIERMILGRGAPAAWTF